MFFNLIFRLLYNKAMTKLGLISDPHASAAPVAQAISIFNNEQVDAIWCSGDIAGYGDELDATISLLQSCHCVSILGNHDIWYLEESDDKVATTTYPYLDTLPLTIQRTIEGKTVYMVHASPPDSLMEGIHLLDQSGHIIESEKQFWTQRLDVIEIDVLIVGHTHQVFAERLGPTLVINPGSSRFNHSCAILSLPDMTVQWFSLSGQSIQKSWNWAMQ
ncbi:MAG: metallophosphoesterase family protein [Gammaproteobacteria bacterium]|jgi:putative phosphoesterase|nr:metallophosphoesterase family protein [Gammaproteobacteria bacterium]